MDPVEIERFHDQGFVVLRQVIDPGPLSRRSTPPSLTASASIRQPAPTPRGPAR